MARLIDVEQQNRWLFDALLRKHVYLEGVKRSFDMSFKLRLNKLYTQFASFVGQTDYQNMDEFTRVELSNFIRKFNTAQAEFYNQYTGDLVKLLQQFLVADTALSHGVMEHITGAEQDVPDTNTLWVKIANAPVPANGLTPGQMISSFTLKSQGDVKALLNKGYANNETVRSTYQAIVGTSASTFRDGLFSQFTNRNDAVISTLLSHVSSFATMAVAADYFAKYQWVSVMDGHTSDICISRNGNIYVMGEGPLPPAHYRCRSIAVPVASDDSSHDPMTFYAWLLTQPDEVIQDMLGTKSTTQFKNGSFVSVSSIPALTVTQFQDKLDMILYELQPGD